MRKARVTFVVICLGICILVVPSSLLARTYSVTCSGDIRSATQSCLDAMKDNDILTIAGCLDATLMLTSLSNTATTYAESGWRFFYSSSYRYFVVPEAG